MFILCLVFQVTTCPAAMGYSFAAGTTDGPGDFDFTQGTNSTNKFWAFVSQFISKPTPEQVKCQAPKPILLNTGEVRNQTDCRKSHLMCWVILLVLMKIQR